MTIITLDDGHGNTRRCDAKCYRAKGNKCTCVCGGRNHGVGRQTAIIQSCTWLQPAALDYPGKDYQLWGHLQLPLFHDRPGHGNGALEGVTP